MATESFIHYALYWVLLIVYSFAYFLFILRIFVCILYPPMCCCIYYPT